MNLIQERSCSLSLSLNNSFRKLDYVVNQLLRMLTFYDFIIVFKVKLGFFTNIL